MTDYSTISDHTSSSIILPRLEPHVIENRGMTVASVYGVAGEPTLLKPGESATFDIVVVDGVARWERVS